MFSRFPHLPSLRSSPADCLQVDTVEGWVHDLQPHQKEERRNCRFEVEEISKDATAFRPFGTAHREAKAEHCAEQARQGVQKFAMFFGYQRSGHTLTGALMDAHPNMIIGQEFNVLHFLGSHTHGMELLLEGLCRNSIACADTARHQTGSPWSCHVANTFLGYSYRVPHGLQGVFTTDGVKVIGDKVCCRTRPAVECFAARRI